MAKDNMGIADMEFYAYAAILIRYANALDGQMQSYLKAVKSICEKGIQDQLICSRLTSLCESVQSLREPLNTIVTKAAKDCCAFVEAVNDADDFLY